MKGGYRYDKTNALPRRVFRNNRDTDVSKMGVRRLAGQGGVKRLHSSMYEEVRCVMKLFLVDIIRDAVARTERERRITVTRTDMVGALQRQGKVVFSPDNFDCHGERRIVEPIVLSPPIPLDDTLPPENYAMHKVLALLIRTAWLDDSVLDAHLCALWSCMPPYWLRYPICLNTRITADPRETKVVMIPILWDAAKVEAVAQAIGRSATIHDHDDDVWLARTNSIRLHWLVLTIPMFRMKVYHRVQTYDRYHGCPPNQLTEINMQM